MRKSGIIIGVILIGAAIGVWVFCARDESGSIPKEGKSAIRVSAATAKPGPIVELLGAEDLVEDLHSDRVEPQEDLAILQQVIYTYRQANGGNPEGGENGAITDRLRGLNEKKVRYLPEDFDSLNEAGELIDRWGTPYHFHSISSEEMEIVSAGPDGHLWTEDDVALP